jgi:predicted component of type VI protein secretion system
VRIPKEKKILNMMQQIRDLKADVGNVINNERKDEKLLQNTDINIL